MLEETWIRVRSADGDRSELAVVGVPEGESLLRGRVDVLDGRLPTSSAEVSLAPDVADDLDVAVGDQLSLTRPDLDLDVVGLVEDPSHLSDPVAVVTPGAALLGSDQTAPPSHLPLIDLPNDVSTAELAQLPPVVQLRADSATMFNDRDSSGQAPWTYVIGGVVLTVVGIVISAAFAVGARRQLVTLGQLSANGAPGPVLRATLVLQGTLTGMAGAVLGLALATVALAFVRGWFESQLDRRFDAYDIKLPQIGGAMAVGVAAATIAALVPVRTATRIPTLAARAGRRPLAPVRHHVTAAGALAVAVGLGLLGLAVLGSATGEDGQIWALVAVIGGVLELLRACAMAPAVVAHLEPLAGRARGSSRWRPAAWPANAAALVRWSARSRQRPVWPSESRPSSPGRTTACQRRTCRIASWSPPTRWCLSRQASRTKGRERSSESSRERASESRSSRNQQFRVACPGRARSDPS